VPTELQYLPGTFAASQLASYSMKQTALHENCPAIITPGNLRFGDATAYGAIQQEKKSD